MPAAEVRWSLTLGRDDLSNDQHPARSGLERLVDLSTISYSSTCKKKRWLFYAYPPLIVGLNKCDCSEPHAPESFPAVPRSDGARTGGVGTHCRSYMVELIFRQDGTDRPIHRRSISSPDPAQGQAVLSKEGGMGQPSPASLARMMAWARSATCNLLRIFET